MPLAAPVEALEDCRTPMHDIGDGTREAARCYPGTVQSDRDAPAQICLSGLRTDRGVGNGARTRIAAACGRSPSR
jgi:hypothetical protein